MCFAREETFALIDAINEEASDSLIRLQEEFVELIGVSPPPLILRLPTPSRDSVEVLAIVSFRLASMINELFSLRLTFPLPKEESAAATR